MSKRPKESSDIETPVSGFRKLRSKVNILFLEYLYRFHIRVRYLHDSTYRRGGWYKNYSDKKLTQTIHKVGFATFIVSFIAFYTLQSLLPYMFTFKPREVQASTTNVTWTTDGDFAYNKNTVCDATTQTNVDISSSYTDATCVAAATDASVSLENGTLFAKTTPENETMQDIFFTDVDTGYIVGLNGASYKTIDGGESWTSMSTGSQHLRSVYFTDANTGFIARQNGAVYDTGNAGSSWASNGLGTSEATLDVHFPSATRGYAVGGGPSANQGYIVRLDGDGSLYGDMTSNLVNVFYSINAVYFTSDTTGVIGGDRFSGIEKMYRTTDGGESWTEVHSLSEIIQDIDFPTSSVGYAVGGDEVLKTTDGGASWSSVTSPTDWLYSVNFIDANIGYIGAAGSGLYKTTNGGTSWTQITSPSLPGTVHGMRSADSNASYLTGTNGKVVKLTENPVYSASGTIDNLKLDTGSTGTPSWSTVSWNGSTPANTAIKFRSRGASTEGGLSSASWSGYYTSSGSSITTNASRWLELEMTLETTDENATPTLNDFTVSYNSLEVPTSPKQYRTDDSSQISNSGWSNLATADLKSTATVMGGISNGETLTPQFEMIENATSPSFTGSPASPGGVTVTPENVIYNSSTGNVDADVADISGLAVGHYWWKMRWTDTAGRVGPWGATADFQIEQTAPTGTITIDEGAYVSSGIVNLSLPTTADTGGSGLSDMRFSNDDATWSTWESNGASKSSWDITSVTYGGVGGDGVKNAYVQFRDNAGNVSTGSISASTTLDTAAPNAFTLNAPSDPTWSSDSTPTLTWNASTDASGLEKYELLVDGGATLTKTINDSTTGATANILTQTEGDPVSYTLQAGEELATGNHTWQIKAYDNAGNPTTSTGAVWNYGYDNASETPTSFGATTNDVTDINLSWTDASTNAPTATINIKRVRTSEYTSESYTPSSNWDSYGDQRGEYGSYTFSAPLAVFADSTVTPVQSQALPISAINYTYAIQVVDDASNTSSWSAVVVGYTSDSVDPPSPSSVTATACDGTGPNCSDIANDGYETKLNWTYSYDGGSGTTGYKIYRRTADSSLLADWTSTELVGYLEVSPPEAGAHGTTYYDNDTNNDATFTDTDDSTPIKTVASKRLNSSQVYYYRVTAVDADYNESEILTGFPIVTQDNWTSGTTTDVVDPSIPASLVATPMGLDSSGTAQRVDVSWGASSDATPIDATRDPAVSSGTGIAGYKVFRCQGNSTYCSNDGNYSQVATPTSASYTNEGLAEFTEYHYKVLAVDKASSSTVTDADNNSSVRSTLIGVTTFSNTVPTVPASVTVTTKTGDPSSDPNVGSQNTIAFNGAYAKNCSGGVNCIVGYEIYRSTTNHVLDADWLDPAKATKLADITISAIQDERTGTYTFIDNDATNTATAPSISTSGSSSPTVTKAVTTALTDTNTYYYKVRSNDNTTPTALDSGLSAVTVGTLHAGWDTTADATAPDTPIDVKVKDIHSNTSMVRNIITWAMIADPEREGSSDFREYQVWRFETAQGIGTSTKVTTLTDRGDNYHVDGIAVAEQNKDYTYYVVAVDDAKTDYTYSDPSSTVINAFDNVSTNSSNVSINPGVAKPTVSNIATSSLGVSSAVVTWDTDQNTDALVEYREKGTNSVVASGKNRTTPVMSHSVDLKALEMGKIYEYRIVSRNSLGNMDETASSTWNEFSTQDFSIDTPAVVTTTTTATVTWTTPITADSSVEYQRQTGLGASDKSKTAGDPALTTSHSVSIKALKPDTNYTYKIRSVTLDSYIAETAFLTFKTQPYDASQFVISPNASEIAEQNITATSAKITWSTLVATTSWIDYGTTSSVYTQSAGNDSYSTVHLIELLNLTPGTTYYYKVRGKDSNDIEYTSKEYSFTAVLKPSISSIKVTNITSYEATVNFTTNVDTTSFVALGEDATYGSGVGDNNFKRNHSVTLENLTDNVTYHYRITVKDKLSNEASSSNTTFSTPIDLTGPVVSEVKIDILPMGTDDETASAIISWTTDKPSTTQMEYDEGIIGTNYSETTIPDESLNRAHTVIVKELSSATTYRFRVIAKDKRENITKSDPFNFVTPQKERSVLQLIIRSLEETFSWVKDVGRKLGEVRQSIFGR